MKERLITNGILSLLNVIFFISMIVGIVGMVVVGASIEALDFPKSWFIYWLIFRISFLFWCITSIILFIMGILTLSMKKYSSVKGLTIASGILAIFGGVCGVNTIVSFIAASKMKKIPK